MIYLLYYKHSTEFCLRIILFQGCRGSCLITFTVSLEDSPKCPRVQNLSRRHFIVNLKRKQSGPKPNKFIRPNNKFKCFYTLLRESRCFQYKWPLDISRMKGEVYNALAYSPIVHIACASNRPNSVHTLAHEKP